MEGRLGGHDPSDGIGSLTEPLVNIFGLLGVNKPENTTVIEIPDNRVPKEKLLWLSNVRPSEKSCNTCCKSWLFLRGDSAGTLNPVRGQGFLKRSQSTSNRPKDVTQLGGLGWQR